MFFFHLEEKKTDLYIISNNEFRVSSLRPRSHYRIVLCVNNLISWFAGIFYTFWYSEYVFIHCYYHSLNQSIAWFGHVGFISFSHRLLLSGSPSRALTAPLLPYQINWSNVAIESLVLDEKTKCHATSRLSNKKWMLDAPDSIYADCHAIQAESNKSKNVNCHCIKQKCYAKLHNKIVRLAS